MILPVRICTWNGDIKNKRKGGSIYREAWCWGCIKQQQHPFLNGSPNTTTSTLNLCRVDDHLVG